MTTKNKMRLNLPLTILLLSISFVKTTDYELKRRGSSTCDWTDWGDYGPCQDGKMTRVRNCYCDGSLAPLRECTADVPFSDTVACGALDSDNATQLHDELYLQQGYGQQQSIGETIVDEPNSPGMIENTALSTEQSVIICAWKWTRWTRCTQPCGTNPLGNTTRTQQCWCVGTNEPYENETMCLADGTQATETVECNAFACGGVRPRNKLYWISLAEQSPMSSRESVWPFPTNTTFPCTRGDPFNFSQKSWLEILMDDIYVQNPAWHYLAKEYITARLNRAIGCIFTKPAEFALEEAQYLLTQCGNFSNEEIEFTLFTKEKLARYNNGIGGLSNVDLRSGLAQTGGGLEGIETDEEPSGMSVVLPLLLMVVVLVGVAVLYAMYITRMEKKRKLTVIENETFLSSSEEEEKDDRSAEELRL